MNNQSSGQMAKQQTVDIYSGGPATPAYMAAIAQAHIDGKKIQYKSNQRVLGFSTPTDWTKVVSIVNKPNGQLNWCCYSFRVDPTDRPKKLVPLDVSDLGPTTWIRGATMLREAMVVGIDPNTGAIYFPHNEVLYLDSMFVNGRGSYEYSTDRKTWLPTHKEVPVD